ncbi:MAG: hypothetical protein AAGE84_25415 [Cyanobacteria bacterium P01_G01_bin.39]
MEDPAVGLSLRSTKGISTEKRTLHVSWSKREAELSYTIYSSNPEEEGEWVQPSPDKSEQIANFWRKLNYILGETIPKGSPSQETWESICISLQGIGQSLFNSLIPSQVADCIKEWESGFSVRVSTNEQWIPWELMYDGQNFLGDKFIFTRYPRLKDRRVSSDKNRSKYQRSKQVKKIVNVVGGNIGEQSAQKASELFIKISESISIQLLREQSISKLTKALDQADILHFTCHGHLDPINLLQISSGKSPIENLCLDTAG